MNNLEKNGYGRFTAVRTILPAEIQRSAGKICSSCSSIVQQFISCENNTQAINTYFLHLYFSHAVIRVNVSKYDLEGLPVCLVNLLQGCCVCFLPHTHINSLASERCGCNFKLVIFKLISRMAFLMKLPSGAAALYWWLIIIGSGNGLVPSGTKSLSEPMLTQICAIILHH